MYIGMAPLTSVASIISEEKEKNTLRVLLMANMKPWQYLIGIGIYVWSICMVGAGVMATGLPKHEIFAYLLIMAVGFAISILAGACIGIFAKNQMSATSLVMPVMMILSFLPMLAMFNEKIEKAARFFYTWQLKICVDDMSLIGHSNETYIVLLVNIIITVIIFGVTFKKKGLE